jgi:hypothetical protein
MKTNGVLRQCLNYIGSSAGFECARLFPNNFEAGANPQSGQVIRDTQSRIVCCGLNVVLGIEPQDDIYGPTRK